MQSCDDSFDEDESFEDEERSWGVTDEQDERIRRIVGNIAVNYYLKGFKAWDAAPRQHWQCCTCP
jgi:hypothetical protein